ncbi:MAG: DNA-formamidopyrimidine glycosylase family protein, partial [Pseudomonadota bacterium]
MVVPELPEVETVRCGLAPVMEGAVIDDVDARRPDLRFPLPADFTDRLVGQRVESLDRRGKYLIAHLSSGESLIMHLGMSGRFTIEERLPARPGDFAHAHECDPKHDHVVFRMTGERPASVTYNDPRRFGFMDLAPAGGLATSPHFAKMGPEPLGNSFSPGVLKAALIKKRGFDRRRLALQR